MTNRSPTGVNTPPVTLSRLRDTVEFMDCLSQNGFSKVSAIAKPLTLHNVCENLKILLSACSAPRLNRGFIMPSNRFVLRVDIDQMGVSGIRKDPAVMRSENTPALQRFSISNAWRSS